MRMKMLSWEQSKKVLHLVAAISTHKHREQIIKRNQEVLDKDESHIHCPHCINEYKCKTCLWTYAYETITGHKKKHAACLNIRFAPVSEIRCAAQTSTEDLDMWHNSITVRFRSPDVIKFLNKHIAWASKKDEWQTTPPPDGYRTEAY